MEDEKVIQHLEEALRRTFAFGQENQRFVDVSRIPLICQSIVQMAADVKEIKEDMVSKDRFVLVERVVYGGVSLILVGVLGALIQLVVK